jgi:hypothetical protein
MKSILPDLLDFSEINIRAFPRIYLSDSIFEFYPYGEVYFNDPIGQVSDEVYFIEGLEFETKMGIDPDFLEHKYLWAEDTVNDIKIQNFISGTKVFVLLSAYIQNDIPQSRAWEDTISNVVNTVIADFSPTTTNVSSTTGSGKRYQFNLTNKEFLKDLANIAYTDSATVETPYYTFCNCAGDFYFMHLEELFGQAPVADFKFTMDEESVGDETAVQNAEIYSIGLPATREGYNRKVYKLNETGVVENAQFLISSHFVKQDTSTSLAQKLLIRKDTAQESAPTDIVDLSVVENLETEFVKGRIINMYKDAALSYRFSIIIKQNVKTVAGKTITLDIDSSNPNKGKATEYNGKWLILESEHYADIDGIPYTKLTLGKSGIPVDSNHAEKANFIG